MPRQNPDQNQPRRRDPVITPPDEDEVDVEEPGQQQQARGNPRNQPESNVEQIEDEEAQEDEEDGLGPNS